MDHIEHPAAYLAAIERNIAINRRIGGQKRWYAAHPDAPHLRDWLLAQGEFASKDIYDANGEFVKVEHHPMSTDRMRNDFINNMRLALLEWGGLTENQTVAVRNAMARAAERLEMREQRKTDQRNADLNSQHLGTVGERIVLTLKVRHVVMLEGMYGLSFINICNDESGNVVVYKGSNSFEFDDTNKRRDQITVKATVKAHTERDGVKQTIIARPKISE